MPKVQHPTFPEVVIDIPVDALKEHLAAGWVELEPFIGERGPEIVPLPKGSRVTKK